eukprot:COSAG02_NODE_76_length_41115_cov_60.967817_4_plen_75_part_00
MSPLCLSVDDPLSIDPTSANHSSLAGARSVPALTGVEEERELMVVLTTPIEKVNGRLAERLNVERVLTNKAAVT